MILLKFIIACVVIILMICIPITYGEFVKKKTEKKAKMEDFVLSQRWKVYPHTRFAPNTTPDPWCLEGLVSIEKIAKDHKGEYWVQYRYDVVIDNIKKLEIKKLKWFLKHYHEFEINQ